MTQAAGKCVLEFSPTGRDNSADNNKENAVPLLTLTQFSKAPFVSFGTVKVGTSRSATLCIDNPTEGVRAEVLVEKIASRKGFSVEHEEFVIEAEGSFSLTITWTPTEEGGVRELVVFNANGVLKHQAVLLGRAEAPKRKKKTLWDAIKNKPGTAPVSRPRVKKTQPTLKMAANKTFQVSRKTHYQTVKPRSPLSSLNQAPSNRERHLSTEIQKSPAVQDEQENSPFARHFPEKPSMRRTSQDLLTLPENKDISKLLNKTVSPIGTPDRLKRLMPRIETTESPISAAAAETDKHLVKTPTLSEALSLIDSDLSPIISSPQESSCDFSDSLESTSGRLDQIPDPLSPEANEQRLTFFVGKKAEIPKVKMFTSTTVTKAPAPVEANSLSGRKIKKSRRKLLEKTLELTDSSVQSESRPETPGLPVIAVEIPSQHEANLQNEPEAKEEQPTSGPQLSPTPISFLITSPQPRDPCVSVIQSSVTENPVPDAFPLATLPEDSPVPEISSPHDSVPLVSSNSPIFLASSPEPFPIHVVGKGKKRKSEEVLKDDVKLGEAMKSEQVKRSRNVTVKREPSKAMPERRRAVPTSQAQTTASGRANSVKSAAKSLGTKHSAVTVKSAVRKSKIVAVAQSKLTFIKPTQTVIPRHPMPFAAKNMFFDERWIEKQERGFTWWLNYVLTPDEFRVNTEVAKVNALSLATGGEVNVPKAPTREEMSFSTYTARRNLNRLRRAACQLFTSDAMVQAIRRLELEVEAKRLLVRRDRHLWKDIGERQKVLNWLLSYNPLWLRIGLETIYGELIPLENNGDTLGLALFILQRLLWNPELAAEHRHATVPHLYREGHEEALSRFTLKKLLLLVCFLDKAKESRLIEHNPCLFCMDAEFKSSKDLLLAFSRDFLSGEGILSRHLGYLGLPVSHQQKPLDEFHFSVKNLAVDLKCGIRLVRVMELLTQDWSLSAKLRLPAISRLQKIHNMDLALQALKKKNIHLKDDQGSVIDSRDIVDGHREKTLALLWKIMFAFHVEAILDEKQLQEEISFLQRSFRTKRRLDHLRMDRGPQPSPVKEPAAPQHISPKMALLMDWVRAVCDFYSVKVENFSVSFSDGRALCFLVHHYHPGLAPARSICQRTTQTVESCRRGRLQLHGSDDSDGSFDDSLAETHVPDSPFKELLENEKSNFQLLNGAVSFLGGVPAMINAADMSNTIPDEKVVMSYLSFLCARLLDLRDETRAARIIQDAWRRHRLRKDLLLYQERTAAALKLQSAMRRFLERRRVVRRRRAALVLQAAWRAAAARRELERRRAALSERTRSRAATVIQAHWRMYRAVESYKRLRQYTILVQAQWRMKRAVSKYQRNLWAVSIIQTHTRAWSVAKTQREHFLALRSAAVKIQRGYRYWKVHKIEKEACAAKVIQTAFRKWFEKKTSERTSAAIRIQAWYKMHRCLRTYRKIRTSAMLIQAHYRGCIQRRHFLTLKLEHSSAAVIQSAFRGFLVRKQMAKMVLAATVIQQHLRATLRRNTEQRKFLRMKRAAVTLQAAYRGRRARGIMKTQRKAATVIQTAHRRYVAQKCYRLKIKAAILIQQQYRATSIARKMRSDYLVLRSATVRIQAVWRGRTIRKRLEEQNRCATTIQAWYRRHAALKLYKAKKKSAQVIQHFFRAYQAAKKERKAFLDKRAATVALQAAFRGVVVRKKLKRRHDAIIILQSFVRMALQRQRYKLQQSAAIIIQCQYRASVLCRKQRFEFQQIKDSVLKIQAFYRGYLVRAELKRQHKAALVIQSMFRMFQIRMAYLATKCAAVIFQRRYRAKRLKDKQVQRFRSIKSSAVTIQAAYRGQKTRKHLQKMRNAAVVIQRAFRTHLERNQFLILKSTALICQRLYRAKIIAQKQRRDYLLKRKAVICLQSACRGWLLRKDLDQKCCAATIIQSHFRKYQMQRSYKKLKWAAKVLQECFRAQQKMKAEMQNLKVKREATIVLQAAFRGMRVRRLLKKNNSAAGVIQRAFKAFCQRKRYLALKLAAVIIQQKFRAYSAAKKERSQYLQLIKSAVVLQAVYRGWKVRQEVAHWHEAATVIQSAFRKHREQVKYQAMQLSAVLIQRFYRAWLLKNQQRAAFLKTKQSVLILQAAFRGQRARMRIAKMQKAATLIQANFRRHRQQNIFRKQHWASLVLQKRFRALRQMKMDANHYQQQRLAAIVLQAAYRGRQERQNIKKMHQAARVVQRAYKALRQKRQYLTLRASVVTIQRRFRATVHAKRQRQHFCVMRKATVRIQAAYRGHQVRSEVAHWHEAATVIQSAFRKHRHEVAYQAMRLSALIIQRHYRSWLQQRRQRERFLKLKHSTIVIQANFRAYSVRKSITKMHTAAMVIQKSFRMHKQRTNFRRLCWAAVVFQRRYRAQKQMEHDQQLYQKKRNAVIVLQAAYRGMQLRQQVRKKHHAARVIQSLYRAHRLHLGYLALKHSALAIQRKYRATAAAKKQTQCYKEIKQAAVVLQALFRGHQVRKDLKKRHEAATLIQAAFRKHKEECKYRALQLAAVIIQRRYRALKIQKKQRLRFLQSKRCAIVLQAAIRGYQVRKQLTEMHKAATVIQAHFRRHRKETMFKKQRWAVCVLQQRLRAQMQMKAEHLHFQRQKEAVTVLQAAYRGMRTRGHVRKMNQAASVLQRAYKTYCQRKRYLTLKTSVVTVQRRYRATIAAKKQREQFRKMQKATLSIQAAFRGHKVRKAVGNQHQAATVIQAVFRQHRCQVAYRAMRLSAVIIQRHFRSWLLQKRDRQRFLEVQRSTVVLQAAFRGRQVRRRLTRLSGAAVVIQSQWRGFVQRRQFLKKKETVLKMQRHVRAVQLGNRQRQDYIRQRHSAITLQRHWRLWISKKREQEAAQAERRVRFTAAIFYHLHAIKIQRALRVHWALCSAKKQIHSVLTIQRWVRGWFQRRRYLEERRRVVLVQTTVRRWFHRRQRAASVLQRATRTFLLRRRQARVQRGIIKAQALWRGHRCRRLNHAQVVGLRRRLLSVTAAARDENRLCNKTTTALDHLLKYRQFSYILQALRNLETATRLSPECCERLVESGATNTIFTLIRCCNRSIHCMEVISLSIQILLNLSKYHKTIEAVYQVDSSVETLLDLLQRYREKAGDKVAEKGGSIFTKACFLLALLLQDKQRAEEVTKIPKATERLQSIYKLTFRKQQLDKQRTVVKQKMNASINGSFFIAATPRKSRQAPKFAPDWVLSKHRLKDIVDPLRAIQMVAETLSIVL